jgi:hypothetical protein
MELFNVRAFDPTSVSFYTKEVDLETIISNPYNLHVDDMLTIVLNELRKQRGLEPISPIYSGNEVRS